jgi:RND family efflux transporter MFP subunit
VSGKVFVVSGGIACLAFGLGALFGARLGTNRGAVTAAAPTAAPPPQVSALEAAPGDRNGFVGVVFAKQQVDLESTVEARLLTVPVQLGDRLKKGDTVATLDAEAIRRDLASAAAAVHGAQAEAHAARVELAAAHDKAARLDKLAKASSSVSDEELEAVHYQEKLAAARQEAARARVSESVAAVDKLRQLLETTAITATFDGVVAQRYVDPGTIVGPGRPIVRLISGDDVWVRFAVPEDQVGGVVVGGCVEASLPSLKLSATGKVETVAPQIDAASRMLVVEARLSVPGAWKGRLPVGVEARVHGHPCAPDPG